MKDGIVQRVVIVFFVILAVLGIVSFVAVGNVNRSVATSDWVNHTHAVNIEADAILSSLHEGDSALRTFLITQDPRDQATYREAYTGMNEHLAVAKSLTKFEPQLKKMFDDLEPVLAKRIDLARDLARSRQQGMDAVRTNLLADAGGESLRRVQRAVASIQDAQKNLLRERDKASNLQAQTAKWTVVFGVALNFVLLGFTAWLVKDDIAARTRAAKALEEANAVLEAKVKERTAELAASNETLRAENLERQWGNKSLEHQLRYSNLIINSINDLVFVLTKTMNITRINPAVAHLTRLDAKDLITSPLSRVVRPVLESNGGRDGRDPFAQALRDGRELQDVSVNLLDKDGNTIPYRLNLVPLRDRDKVVGGVVTLRSAAVAAA